MKLNMDIVREVLMVMEDSKYNETIYDTDFSSRFPKHKEDEIQYTCYKLYEGKYIDAMCLEMDNLAIPHVFQLRDITFLGHQFLAKVKDEKRWGLVKKGVSSVKDYSLSALAAIADGITSAAITAYFSQ